MKKKKNQKKKNQNFSSPSYGGRCYRTLRRQKKIDSTNIRDEIAKSQMPDKILTPNVLDYIIENNLYGA